MQRLFPSFYAAVLLIGLCASVGCQHHDSPVDALHSTQYSVANETAQFPISISAYVAEHYPNIPIDEVELKDNAQQYEVELENGVVLYFDANGIFLQVGQGQNIDIASLPQSILDYIADNYSNTTIEGAQQLPNNNYEVELANGIELVLTSQGTLIIAEMSGGNSQDVNIAALPATALNYIDNYYANNTIDKVEQYTDNGTFEVELNDGSHLYFDQNGNFLLAKIDYELPVGELPEAIQQYVATYFPSATILSAEVEANGNYEVHLSNNVELYFDANSNILYEDENQDDNNIPLNLNNIPQPITNYLSQNYPESTIVYAEIDYIGNFEIRLEHGLELFFDANGNFLYLETEFELELHDLALPDTVIVGETAMLTGQVYNASINEFNADLSQILALRYGITTTMPPVLANTPENGVTTLPQYTTIAARASVAFAVPVYIAPDHFPPNQTDIAIVWPDVPTATNSVILNGGHTAITTYVKQN